MPQYSLLRYRVPATDRARVITNLRALMAQLDRDIPAKDSEHNLLLATWNIRDFGKRGAGKHGARLPESYFYIAEILSRFDFVAVQEVNELPGWEDVMDILGPDWDYIATDVTHASLGGNGERLLYLYDRRKVRFQKIAGEIVLPSNMLITDTTKNADEPGYAGKQFRRTPFIARFQSGWFRFEICTVHIYFGDDSGPLLQQRIHEIDRIADYLARLARAKEEHDRRALILLGDFNIMHPEHETMTALRRHGFTVPRKLDRPSNLGGNKYYDQIAFLGASDVIDYIDRGKGAAGIFEMFENLFLPGQLGDYAAHARTTTDGAKADAEGKLDNYYGGDWRTYQLSDHKPMWVRLKTNDADAYLTGLAAAPD